MREVLVKIEGLTAYSASRPYEEALLKGENAAAQDKRRWRERAHSDENGTVYIPGAGFKLALDEVCKVLNEKIKGKGNSTWTSQFVTGVMAASDLSLGVHVDDMKAIKLFVNSDGVRGSGSRVTRYFPIFPKWGGEIEFRIFNDTLPQDIFERYLTQAGILVGVGRGRPKTGCPAGNGRFQPVSFTWK